MDTNADPHVTTNPAETTSRTGKRRGRPPGKQHDVQMYVRLPGAALTALKRVAVRSKTSVSQVVRSAIEAKLAQLVEPLTAIARNPKAAPSRRLRAIELLNLIAKVGLYMSPVGLQIARQRAAANPEAVSRRPRPTRPR